MKSMEKNLVLRIRKAITRSKNLRAEWREIAEQIDENQRFADLDLSPIYMGSDSVPTSEKRETLQAAWNIFRTNIRSVLGDEFGLEIVGDARSYWTKTGEFRMPPESKRFRVQKRKAKASSGKGSGKGSGNAGPGVAAAAPGGIPGTKELTPMQQRVEAVSAFADLAKNLGPVELLSRVYQGIEQAKRELEALTSSVDTKAAASAKKQLEAFRSTPATPKAIKEHKSSV